MKPPEATRTIDPVTFEVLKNSFVNLVDQMAEVIFKTCYSFAIYVRDFSSCLCDAEGNTVAQGTQDIAVHVGTLHFTAQTCLREIGRENLHPGDVILFNDPFTGGTHFCDVRVVRPVFYDGELLAFTVVNGHWSDVGGSVPGSFDIQAEEYYREGLRITPVKIVEEGRLNQPLVKLIISNMRLPWEREGDLKAQIEASRVGAEYLLALCQKYGVETIRGAFGECMDYVEKMTRAEIAKLPPGSYEADDFIDKDPGRAEEGMVRVHLALKIGKDEILYDLTGTDPAVDCFLNSTYSSSYSACITASKMAFPHVPLNSGFYRAVKMQLPEGSCVNAPEPRAVAGFCSGAYEKMMNAAFACWSQVMPQRGLGSAYNLEYLLLGGTDHRPGYNRGFIYYDWLTGGWGGRYGKDGPAPLTPVFGVGLTNQPIEAHERLSPIFVEKVGILQDSCGPGKWRGGPGLEKTFKTYSSGRLVLSYCCDRERSVPQGVFGGGTGIPHGIVFNPGTPQEIYMGATFSGHKLKDGDAVWRPSSGGGGYGDPLERDPQKVLEDVIDEYVSVERARLDYGVVIRPINPELGQYEIDSDATERERAEIREMRLRWLETDPEGVRQEVLAGRLTLLDAIRRYGVILDRANGQVLPATTRQFRESLKQRCAPYWGKIQA